MPGAGRTILVTGGGGYIGSHCILQLLQEDFNVIVVDNFVNSIKGNFFERSEGGRRPTERSEFKNYFSLLTSSQSISIIEKFA